MCLLYVFRQLGLQLEDLLYGSRNCVKRTLRSPEFNEGFFICGEMKLSLLDLGLVFPTIKKPYDIHTTTATITVSPHHRRYKNIITTHWTATTHWVKVNSDCSVIREMRPDNLEYVWESTKLFEELGPLLWNTVGTIAVFLQEIISIYPTLSPPNLSPSQSTRVCNVLALLQCVASHPDTRISFLNANMPLYLYPFLKTTSKLTPFENLRVASLGVIGGSMKVNTKEVIGFYLSSEIISLCLSNMQNGNELTKIVATFIILKIILDDDGLARVCATTENFFGVCRVLNMMLEDLENPPSPRLSRLLISCYSRLSQNCRARVALTTYLPNRLKDANLINFFRDDPKTMRLVLLLHENVGVNRVPLEAGRGGIDDIVGPSLSRK